MTVLFADVVHSMDIAAALEPYRSREIMNQLVHRATVVVQRDSGTVKKFTGDGIMALFGAPVALHCTVGTLRRYLGSGEFPRIRRRPSGSVLPQRD